MNSSTTIKSSKSELSGNIEEGKILLKKRKLIAAKSNNRKLENQYEFLVGKGGFIYSPTIIQKAD